MDDELEPLIAVIESWQPHREAMRQRAVAWLRTPGFRTAFYDDAHPPLALKVQIELDHGKAKAAEMWSEVLGVQSPELWQQYQQLATSGVVVFAHFVIANPEFTKQPKRSVPCLIVVSEDQSSAGVACAGLLAAAAGELYVTGEGAEERPQLHALVRDDEFRLFRRRPLPTAEIQDFPAFFLDVQMRRAWTPPLDRIPFVPLLIMPGGGAVVHIPWSIATGTPPLPGTMEKGVFAFHGEIDRQADAMIARQADGSGSWARKIPAALVLFGVIGGLYMKYFDPSLRDGQRSTPSKSHVTQDPVKWAQPVSVEKSVSVGPAAEYEPLIGEGLMGAGFLFHSKPGIYLAATSRHQFEDRNKAPQTLSDIGDLTVTLDPKEVMRFPESQIQMITAVSHKTTCLEFQVSDVINEGDELWLILEKGRWITGRLATRGRQSLSAGPRMLRMTVKTTEKVGSASGSPVVHAKTGRVIGVMQGADKADSPTVLEFETLYLNLSQE